MHKMVVLASAVPGRAEDLARWYDERHIPDLLAVPGVLSAERHMIVPLKAPPGARPSEFMLIYELAGDDPMAVVRAMGKWQAEGKMTGSDALDQETTISIVGQSLGKHASAD